MDSQPEAVTRRLDGQVLMVRIPMRFEHFGGRKVVIAPEGALDTPGEATPPQRAIIRALARAYRWQRMLENGTYASVAELAAAEKVNPGYLGRVLRLTLLAPDIVAAILEGRQLPGLSLLKLLRGFPAEWAAQRSTLELPAVQAEEL